MAYSVQVSAHQNHKTTTSHSMWLARGLKDRHWVREERLDARAEVPICMGMQPKMYWPTLHFYTCS